MDNALLSGSFYRGRYNTSILNFNVDKHCAVDVGPDIFPIAPLLNLDSSIQSHDHSQKYPTASLISKGRSHLAHVLGCHYDRSHEPHFQIIHVVAFADEVIRNA